MAIEAAQSSGTLQVTTSTVAAPELPALNAIVAQAEHTDLQLVGMTSTIHK